MLDHAPQNLLTRNCWDVIDDVDVVVELIGGIDPAGALVRQRWQPDKPVVTANKLLLAKTPTSKLIASFVTRRRWAERFRRSKLSAHLPTMARIVSLSGVLNGTCNYILDRIAAGCSWEQAVAEAQEQGFAEADPSADLSGPTPSASCGCSRVAPFRKSVAHSIDSTGIDADRSRLGAIRGARGQSSAAGRHRKNLADGSVHLDVNRRSSTPRIPLRRSGTKKIVC